MSEEEPAERQLADLVRRVQELEARPGTGLPAVRSAEQTSGTASTALAAIDAQIATSSPRDTYLWIQARGEIVQQDEFVRDQAHLRTVEKLALGAKLGLSALAIGGGIGLAFANFGLPAFMCLGAGLYGLAPNFIDAVARRVLGRSIRHRG